MDESNVLDSSFLERMNTLLANGEVPGLFEGDEYTTLMTQCKEGATREGSMLDSSEELYKWFTQQVSSLFRYLCQISEWFSELIAVNVT
jgi:dynein heavy chain 1